MHLADQKMAKILIGFIEKLSESNINKYCDLNIYINNHR